MNYSRLGDTLTSQSTTGEEAVFAVFGFFLLLFLIVILFAIVFKIITRWIFFKKCGEEGWKSLIPIYTDFTLIKIAGLNWWWLLILYAGTILSLIQSSFNVIREFDSSTSVAPIMIFISFLSFFASLGALFARINYSFNISKKFNKSGGYTALIIFFEPIMLLVLGLSKSDKYDETVEVSPNGLIGIKPTKSSIYCPDCGTEVQQDFCPNCGKKVR